MSIRALGKQFVVGALIISLIVPASLAFFPTPIAHADTSACITAFTSTLAQALAAGGLSEGVSVPAADNGKTVGSAIDAGNSEKSYIQDCFIHGLALAAGKAILTAMTNEMVTWINSGFNGNPAFVTNPQQFFENIGDQLAGQLILGSDLGFLCSPFQLQLKIALALNYSYNSSSGFAQRSQCTLSQVVGNINNAQKDIFNNSNGWAGFFSLTQNPANNPMGAYLMATAELDSRISNAQNTEAMQLGWGNGFLTLAQCTDASGKTYIKYGGTSKNAGSPQTVTNTDTNNNTPAYQSADQCVNTTPGHVIASQLDSQLGVPAQQLGLADDFDKILNALQNQMFKEIFEGAQGSGLLGSTQAGSGKNSGSSRLSDWATDSQASSTQANKQANSDLKTSIDAQSNQTTDIAAAPEQNLAISKLASASCAVGGQPATKLVDGDKDNEAGGTYNGSISRQENACDPTAVNPKNAWDMVDLGKTEPLNEIRIYQRSGAGGQSTKGLTFHVEVLDENNNVVWSSKPPVTQDFTTNPFVFKVQDGTLPSKTNGRFVRVQADTPGRLEIAEIEVYPNSAPVINLVGGSTLYIQPGFPFHDPGYSISDIEDGDLTHSPSVHVDGADKVDTSQPSTTPFTITYSVTDSGGLTTTVTRMVFVQQILPNQSQ